MFLKKKNKVIKRIIGRLGRNSEMNFKTIWLEKGSQFLGAGVK